MSQGLLSYHYEASAGSSGLTAFAGLPTYLDLSHAAGLVSSIKRHLGVRSDSGQGWTDSQIVMSLIMLNLSGGDCVDDLRLLESDEGLCLVLRRVENHGMSRKERRAKEDALYCYDKYKAYQPLNTYWHEQDLVIHSEFRDGNVPAGYQQLRVFKEALEMLPSGVEQIFLRSDTAGYQKDLLRYCAEGKHDRFGVVEFAVGADVTQAFRQAVSEVDEADWRTLYRPRKDGQKEETNQQWAEVCFVPDWAGQKKEGPEYRFLAVREPLEQPELPGLENQESLPFPTMELEGNVRYKISGMVTNRKLDGEDLIWWYRRRCGKSEEVHSVMKEDLAGGKFPSGDFGENAAWWGIMILALNLNSAMKNLVLDKGLASKRLKAIRFTFINVAGRVMKRSRRLIIRLCAGHPSNRLLLDARRKILCLAQGPPPY